MFIIEKEKNYNKKITIIMLLELTNSTASRKTKQTTFE